MRCHGHVVAASCCVMLRLCLSLSIMSICLNHCGICIVVATGPLGHWAWCFVDSPHFGVPQAFLGFAALGTLMDCFHLSLSGSLQRFGEGMEGARHNSAQVPHFTHFILIQVDSLVFIVFISLCPTFQATHTDHHYSLLIPNQHDRTRRTSSDLDEASHFDITILSFPLSSPSPVQGQWHGRTELFKFHSRQTGVAIALERCSKGLVHSIIILTWCFRKSFRGAFATTLLAFAQWTFDRTAFAELSRRSLSIWSSPSFRPTFASWV